ncbi:MAG: hypothetical protein ACYDA9_05210 [Terriglobia bacterium]
MAGATYVLDKTYKITSVGGVGKYLAVVPGTNDGDCQLPSGANQVSYGLTQESQPTQNENVIVRKYGISRAVANSPINKGDYVEVAGTTGNLQTANLTTLPLTATLHNVLGIAESSAAVLGQIFFVFLSPHAVVVPHD